MIATILSLLIMLVPKINVDINDNEAINKAFDTLKENKIACCNWPEVRSYAPDAAFKIFHNGKYMFIRYDVRECCTRAVASHDDGKVWEDSCVEAFFSTDGGKSYYNFEASCIGKLHIAHRVLGENGIHADAAHFAMVKRFPSLGDQPFDEIKGDMAWHLIIAIPVEALFFDNMTSWDGAKLTMNFYKCGDKLSSPHYLSWAPINIPRPNFHKPEFFVPVEFE